MSIPLRLLIIEDSEDDMLLQLRELRRGGYEPIYQCVQSAEELQAALERHHWELVLSDYSLPRFNGLEALRLVQASGLDVPFILISGTVGEETAVESMKAGAHDYLLKDRLTRLVPAVRRELSAAAERRQAKTALHESQSLLTLVYDHTAEMLLLCSADALGICRVASVNRAWLDFAGRLGLSRVASSYMGCPTQEVIAALASGPDEAERIHQYLLEASARRRPVTFDQQWQRGDEMFFIEQHLIPVLDEQGEPRHLLWASREVTERKRAEDQQRRLEAQLAHAQKLEALGTLASGIAHDFNNILAGMAGHLELVRADTQDEPHIQENVHQVQQGIQRATDLVGRILAFSRKRTILRRPMHLVPVVHEALAFLRPLIPSGVVVQANLPAECPLVVADAGQMHQVLINLCTNAVHAIGSQQGTLTVTLEATPVSHAEAKERALHPGEYVRLGVRDTGSGMDASTLVRLFEPFFTTKAPGVGTGLGLAVVQNIVKSHRGAIVVTSEIACGTSFDLYFPVAEEPIPEQPPSSTDLMLGQGERILFVDDEEYLTRMGAALLVRLGYQVRVFTDPELALAAFAEEPGSFDALVTDLTMPGLRGTDLASRIRQIRPDLPVILTTGFSGPHEMEKAQAQGFHRILEKPYTLEKFSNLLGLALGRG